MYICHAHSLFKVSVIDDFSQEYSYLPTKEKPLAEEGISGQRVDNSGHAVSKMQKKPKN